MCAIQVECARDKLAVSSIAAADKARHQNLVSKLQGRVDQTINERDDAVRKSSSLHGVSQMLRSERDTLVGELKDSKVSVAKESRRAEMLQQHVRSVEAELKANVARYVHRVVPNLVLWPDHLAVPHSASLCLSLPLAACLMH